MLAGFGDQRLGNIDLALHGLGEILPLRHIDDTAIRSVNSFAIGRVDGQVLVITPLLKILIQRISNLFNLHRSHPGRSRHRNHIILALSDPLINILALRYGCLLKFSLDAFQQNGAALLVKQARH
ncbi:hypothetical protein ADN00_05680 [Ornatilinea apprima]|uniref:Uncharacterized protein n=1 Tax=Ornatilinea apprima TaxID=1134406 RepID=A0A0P6YA78_9CHLR|nr:hypothetical protein ADN00_05680 [Ornatilinea apprima]